MASSISASDLIQSLQRIQEKYEELAIRHESVLAECESLKKRSANIEPCTALSVVAIPQPGRHSKEEVQRHIDETKAWRRKNPWALVKALVYARRIRRLHLFDFEWYRRQNELHGEDIPHPFRHFIRSGLFEGRDPSPGFNTWHYLEKHLGSLNPAEPAIFHYIREGRKQGLSANRQQMSDMESMQAGLLAMTEVWQVDRQQQTQALQQLKHQGEELAKLVKKVEKKLADIEGEQRVVLKEIGMLMAEHVKNEVRQLQNFISLQAFMNDQSVPMEYRGWPISPDIGAFLVEHLSRNQYDAIIEFGSGTSTVLMAKVLQRMREKDPSLKTRIVSFEHLPQYRKKTQTMLEMEELEGFATVVDAPLVPFQSFNGMSFKYYDCDATLAWLAGTVDGGVSKLFALVDGPPQATNPMARLPALEVLARHFPCSDLEMVLDDYKREDERSAVGAWKKFCEDSFMRCELKEIPAEKGAVLVSVLRG